MFNDWQRQPGRLKAPTHVIAVAADNDGNVNPGQAEGADGDVGPVWWRPGWSVTAKHAGRPATDIRYLRRAESDCAILNCRLPRPTPW